VNFESQTVLFVMHHTVSAFNFQVHYILASSYLLVYLIFYCVFTICIHTYRYTIAHTVQCFSVSSPFITSSFFHCKLMYLFLAVVNSLDCWLVVLSRLPSRNWTCIRLLLFALYIFNLVYLAVVIVGYSYGYSYSYML